MLNRENWYTITGSTTFPTPVHDYSSTSISIVPGQIKLQHVPGQNQKTQFTKYSSILIDDFPEWRVIVHPKPLGVTVGIFVAMVLLKSWNDKKRFFRGSCSLYLRNKTPRHCNMSRKRKNDHNAPAIPVVNVGTLTLQQTSEDVLQ